MLRFLNAYFLIWLGLLGPSHCNSSLSPMNDPKPLAADQRIDSEAPLTISLGQSGVPTTSISIPTLEALWATDRLYIGACAGSKKEAESSRDKALEELKAELGGLFEADLTDFTQMHAGLVSPETLAQYNAPGMSLTVDEPQEAFYHLAFGIDEWAVYGLGEAGRFHTVFLGRIVEKGEVLEDNGNVRESLREATTQALQSFLPKLNWQEMEDQSNQYSPSDFILYLQQEDRVVKSGVRKLQGNSLVERYFWGIRVQWGRI